MAGMDWFRWHHGAVTDPKFQLVARKSGTNLPSVLAVWAYVLETASQSAERGTFGEIDGEALDCLFGFADGATAAILAAMLDRGLIDGCKVCSWEKRQPKREREDPTNADRQRTFKAKRNQVTPDNASDNQKTPREEKSREEEKRERHSEAKASGGEPPADAQDQVYAIGVALLTAADLTPKNARSFLAMQCKSHGAPAVVAALNRCAEARPVQPVPWLVEALKTAPTPKRQPAEPAWRTEQRERTQQAAPGVAAGMPAAEFFIDVAARDVTTPALTGVPQ